MPFGPVNGPVIFIVFIHDLDSTWKALAQERGISIDEKTNTNIIVDDIFSWAPTFDKAIEYLKCQLDVCISQNLSLSLKKCLFFPKRMELVGIDVCEDGNRPAMSKHELLKNWPTFTCARNVASFLGFVNFYSKFIPYFEQRAAPLRALAKMDLDTKIPSLTDEQQQARTDLMEAIVSNPCIAQYDHKKRPYLLTDFSKVGFGYVV
jgi:hypothetical protein